VLDDFSDLQDGSIISASLDDSDTSFSLSLGYKINPNFAIEGGYIDLGELTVNATSTGGFFYAPGPVTVKVEADGLFFDAKGILPINEQFSLYGKLGLLMWDEKGTLSDVTGSISADDDGTDVFFGVGASFNISEKISLNADFSRYAVDEDSTDVDVLSVGIQFGF
jgi:OOP family OmpA-OmpF porin